MIQIEEYKAEYWDRICDIHDQARLDELKGSVDLAAFKTLEETYEEEELFSGEVWVAKEGEEVLGFIAFDPEEITWLYVDPAYYKMGVGKTLIEHAISRCDDLIKIVVLSGNQPAINLYTKLGFELVRVNKGKLVGAEEYDAEGWIMHFKKNMLFPEK